MRIDLPARLLRFVDAGDGIDDADQWRILEGLPTNIGALKGKLRRTPDMGLKLWDAEAPPTPVATPAPAAPQPSKRRAALAWMGEQAGKIAVGVVTALIVAAILFVVKGGS